MLELRLLLVVPLLGSRPLVLVRSSWPLNSSSFFFPFNFDFSFRFCARFRGRVLVGQLFFYFSSFFFIQVCQQAKLLLLCVSLLLFLLHPRGPHVQRLALQLQLPPHYIGVGGHRGNGASPSPSFSCLTQTQFLHFYT